MRGERLTLTRRQSADGLVRRKLVPSQELLDALGAVARDGKHDDSDLRGVQVRRRVTQDRGNRHAPLLDVDLQSASQDTHFGRAFERIQTLDGDGGVAYGPSCLRGV